MTDEVRELLDKLEKTEGAPLIWFNKKLYEYPKEIERLKEENKELEEIIGIRDCQLEEMQQQKTDYTQVNILEIESERLKDIIKEARYYIQGYIPNYDFDKTNLIKLLEILNKVGKE